MQLWAGPAVLPASSCWSCVSDCMVAEGGLPVQPARAATATAAVMVGSMRISDLIQFYRRRGYTLGSKRLLTWGAVGDDVLNHAEAGVGPAGEVDDRRRVSAAQTGAPELT